MVLTSGKERRSCVLHGEGGDLPSGSDVQVSRHAFSNAECRSPTAGELGEQLWPPFLSKTPFHPLWARALSLSCLDDIQAFCGVREQGVDTVNASNLSTIACESQIAETVVVNGSPISYLDARRRLGLEGCHIS